MIRDSLPRLDAWADGGFSFAAETTSGELTVYCAQGGTTAPLHDLKDALSNAIGIRPADPGPYGPGTKISVFHRGGRLAAVCHHTAEVVAEDQIRELVAAMLFSASSLEKPPSPTLDPKEIAYLKKIVEGLSDADAADALNLSLRAIKERKKRTLTDLNANSMAHAIALAAGAGLI